MSAMVQPAERSSRIRPWRDRRENVSRLAMKWTPQKTMSVACSLSAANRASLNKSPRRSAQRITWFALIVMAEDQQPIAQLGLCSGRSVRRARRRTRPCSGPAGAPVDGACCGPPEGEGSDRGRRGQPGRPPRGCRPRNLICGRNQAGLRSVALPVPPSDRSGARSRPGELPVFAVVKCLVRSDEETSW